METTSPRQGVAVLASFSGSGGVERMLVNLLRALHARGLRIDLLLLRADSPYLEELPPGIRQIPLAGRHSLLAIPAMARHLRRARPAALLVAKDRAGRSAVLARALAGVSTPILLRLGTHLSTAMAERSAPERWLRYRLIRWLYPSIEAVVAVSQGVADDVMAVSRLPPARIHVVRNPVITPEIATRASAPCAHPWLSARISRGLSEPISRTVSGAISDGSGEAVVGTIGPAIHEEVSQREASQQESSQPEASHWGAMHREANAEESTGNSHASDDQKTGGMGAPPVILAVGRLQRQKDFPTLIRAFARLRQQRPCRLLILGEGSGRPGLERLLRELGLEQAVALPGFVANPYPYMARASLLVLSSAWEGSPNVLTEAMALGTPVVATDCPSGPAEILQQGRFGPLAPVGDAEALAAAMAATLDAPLPAATLRAAVSDYQAERSAERYLELLRQIAQPSSNRPSSNRPSSNRPSSHKPSSNQPSCDQPLSTQPWSHQPPLNQPPRSRSSSNQSSSRR